MRCDSSSAQKDVVIDNRKRRQFNGMATVQGYSSDTSSDADISYTKKSDTFINRHQYRLDPKPEVDSVVGTHDSFQLLEDEAEQVQSYGAVIEKQQVDPYTLKQKLKQPKRATYTSSKKKKKRKTNDATSLDYRGPWQSSSESLSDKSDDNSKGINEAGADDKEYELESASEATEIQLAGKKVTELFADIETIYPGGTYMHVPVDCGINLSKNVGSWECFSPRKVVYSFDAHKKGVNKLEFFPGSGHLLLSCGNDGEIKLWDVYHKRKLLRAFYGHSRAVKDVQFNSSGTEFLSCSYDRKVILWCTESGSIKKTIQVNAIPNAVKFNPNNENEIIVGLSNHKIFHYDLSSPNLNNPIQIYSHHLGAINSLLVVDDSKRFLSTSDDKSVRIWDWQIDSPVKVISDPTQHSMPVAALHPDQDFIALQSMDNTVQVVHGHGKFKFSKKKVFKGHNVAGYGIEVCFSPDGRILMSGDTRGVAIFWDWKTCKVVRKIKLCDNPITCIKSHPQEVSKVALAGLDGKIFFCA